MKCNRFVFKVLFFLVFYFIMVYGFTQEAAKPIDHTILARPTPLFTVADMSGFELLSSLSDSLRRHGYEIIKFDRVNMQIESRFLFSSENERYDKIIVWLERDFHMPEKFIKVYLIFGRFEKIIGNVTRIRRIEISKESEDLIIGDLKKSINSISN